jgi:hypothetical protein
MKKDPSETGMINEESSTPAVDGKLTVTLQLSGQCWSQSRASTLNSNFLARDKRRSASRPSEPTHHFLTRSRETATIAGDRD